MFVCGFLGFFLDEVRILGLVIVGVFLVVGLVYLKLFRDKVNVIEMVKVKRFISNIVSVLFGFMC